MTGLHSVRHRPHQGWTSDHSLAERLLEPPVTRHRSPVTRHPGERALGSRSNDLPTGLASSCCKEAPGLAPWFSGT